MASYDIRIEDHSAEVMRLFRNQLEVALNAVGTQAVSHAAQIITDAKVYGGVDLKAYGEKDNSRVDTGKLRQSISHRVRGTAVYIGTNLDYAPYHELGTGIYASQPGGRQTPWFYVDAKGVGHMTRGLYPIHFLKKAASNYTAEYEAIMRHIMGG